MYVGICYVIHTSIKDECIYIVIRDNPAERLGYLRNGLKDVKRHRWFQVFDWDGLVNRTLQPPIIPDVCNLFYIHNLCTFDGT